MKLYDNFKRKPKKEFKRFMRRCHKCNKIYYTTCRRGKCCDACKHEYKKLNEIEPRIRRII